MARRQLLSLPGDVNSACSSTHARGPDEATNRNLTLQGPKSFITRICYELDGCRSRPDSLSPSVDGFHSSASSIFDARDKADAVLNDAVCNAVYAYSIRWLALSSAFQKSRSVDAVQARHLEQDVRNHLWRRARMSMYPAMSRPTYRSVLALFCFTLTETPLDHDDQGFLHLCSQVLLSHFWYLRTPDQPLEVRPLSALSTVLPLTPGLDPSIVPTSQAENVRIRGYMEDTMFWLGVLHDISRSIMHRLPSVILPGASGDKKVWDFIRQRTVIFDQSFRALRSSPLPLSHDITMVLLQHASACKTMYYGVISQFFDAVIHHNAELREETAQRVLDESRRFHDVFDQLLALCARDYMTLTPDSQLHYC